MKYDPVKSLELLTNKTVYFSKYINYMCYNYLQSDSFKKFNKMDISFS